MKTLNLYVTRGFLLTFFMAIGILTFGMMGGRLVQVIEAVAQGISFTSFMLFVLYTLPVVLSFTVPLAVMVAVMMVFGRLSADSEITAMRACGISILQIVSPILLITFILTGVCCYLQIEVGPPCLGKAREVITNAFVDQPLAMFAPGQATNQDGYIVYLDDKIGDSELRGVQIYEVGKKFNIIRDISAPSGRLKVNKEAKILTLELDNCIIIDRSSELGAKTAASMERFELEFDYGQELNSQNVGKRPKFMTMSELLARIRMNVERDKDTTDLEVELNQRIAFALSPIAFLLFGLPLAIQTSRRETSVGLFLSVILAGGFFLLVIICESLTDYPKLYPQYLLWLPTLAYQIGGAVMIYRITRR